MLRNKKIKKIKKKLTHYKKYRVVALIILLLLVLCISFEHNRREGYKRYLVSEKLNDAFYKDKEDNSSNIDLQKANNVDINSIVPEQSGLVTRGVIIPLYDKNNEFSGKERVSIDEGHKKDGVSSVKLTKLGSDSESFSYERKINLSFNDEDTVGFWLYKDDSYNLDADSEIDIFLQSYNSEYNYFEAKIKGTDLTDGWNFIKLKKKDFIAMGSALWKKIDHFKVTINSKSKDNVSISLSSIEVNNSIKPTVILCVDGSDKEISDYVFPLVSKYNFKITNFLNPSSVIEEKEVEKTVSVIADNNGNAIKDGNGKSIEASSDAGKAMLDAQKQEEAKAAADKNYVIDENTKIKTINEKQKEIKTTYNIDASAYNHYIESGTCEIGLRSEDSVNADILNDYNKQYDLFNKSKNALCTVGLNINNSLSSYAFSSNSYNRVNGQALKDLNFNFIRNGNEGLINYYHENNHNVVPSVMLNDSNVENVKEYIDQVIDYKSAMCLYTNNVMTSGGNAYMNVTNNNYEDVLEYLSAKCKSGELQVVCVSDFVNESK